MKTFAKIATTFAVAALATTTALAATTVTRQSVEKAALTAHPGKIASAKEMKEGKETVWQVKIKGNDGKDYTMAFDAATGKELTASQPMKSGANM